MLLDRFSMKSESAGAAALRELAVQEGDQGCYHSAVPLARLLSLPQKMGDTVSFSKDELLQPSLSHSAMAKAPYSLQTTFVTAFLGGPLAAIAITALNSVRLQRWVRDLAPLSMALVAYIGFLLIFTYSEWGINHRSA